jgi:hypothetical protein
MPSPATGEAQRLYTCAQTAELITPESTPNLAKMPKYGHYFPARAFSNASSTAHVLTTMDVIQQHLIQFILEILAFPLALQAVRPLMSTANAPITAPQFSS